MEYIVEQKIFSLKDRFYIRDRAGQEKFYGEGRLLSLNKQISLYNLQGEEVLKIEEKLLRLLAEYSLSQEGRILGQVRKKLSLLPRVDIGSVYGDYTIEGNFFAHNFVILKGSREVAQISKDLLNFRDSYLVQVEEGENQEFILGLALVLDLIFHNGRGQQA